MLSSIRDKIVTGFCDALQGDGAPAAAYFRSLTRPLHQGDSIPAIVVMKGVEAITPETHESQLRKLALLVVCVWADPGTDDETVDQKVEVLTNWVEAVIGQDETLGGLALRTEVTQIQWHLESVDLDYVGAEMTVEVQYYTARNAPDQAG